MALVLNQVVEVRVAVVLQATDLSVGQVWDGTAWADLVWIDLAGSSVLPQEFGDAHFVGEVSSLALTRSSVSRPTVRLRAWVSGGTRPDGYRLLTTGSSTSNQAAPRLGTTDLVTTLPGLGAVANVVRIRGFSGQQIGWTGRIPLAPAWDRSTLALRKRLKYQPADFYENQLLVGVAGFAGDLSAFTGWLAANRPEYGAPLTVGAMVAVHLDRAIGTSTYRYHYLGVFTVSCFLNTSYNGWAWTARGSVAKAQTNEFSNSNLCGGNSSSRLLSGEAFATNAANAATSQVAAHTSGTLSGSFTTPPAGGGSVTASPRARLYTSGPIYGVDLTFTVDAEGRITGANLAGFGDGCTVITTGGWGACKTEGGLLA